MVYKGKYGAFSSNGIYLRQSVSNMFISPKEAVAGAELEFWSKRVYKENSFNWIPLDGYPGWGFIYHRASKLYVEAATGAEKPEVGTKLVLQQEKKVGY